MTTNVQVAHTGGNKNIKVLVQGKVNLAGMNPDRLDELDLAGKVERIAKEPGFAWVTSDERELSGFTLAPGYLTDTQRIVVVEFGPFLR